jgi:hypothetical protein
LLKEVVKGELEFGTGLFPKALLGVKPDSKDLSTWPVTIHS